MAIDFAKIWDRKEDLPKFDHKENSLEAPITETRCGECYRLQYAGKVFPRDPFLCFSDYSRCLPKREDERFAEKCPIFIPINLSYLKNSINEATARWIENGNKSKKYLEYYSEECNFALRRINWKERSKKFN